MAIGTIPLEDNYNSTLSQAWNGAVGTVYVNAAPTFTFPSTRKCYIVVDPGTSKMQVARISAYNSTLKTITVDSTAVYKGAGVLYTEQSHRIGAKVIISDNYQFWADLADELDNKLDDDGGNGVDYASTVLRDAALGGDGVATKNYRMIKAGSAYYNYNLSVGQRQIVDTGTAVNVATESTDGIVRLADQTQVNAGTDTEGGSPLVVQPGELKVVTDALALLANISFLPFGSGVDGDVVINSGTTTLTKDMQYNNLTITSPGVLDPAGYRVFVRGTLSGTGTINRNGNNGSAGGVSSASPTSAGGAAGTTLGQGSLNAEIGAGAGGNGTSPGVAGTAGTASTLSLSNVSSVQGGAGGAGGSGAGAAAGALAASTRGSKYNTVINNISLLFHSATAQGLQFEAYKGKASSSGGGGGTGNGDAGGAGGGAGGNGGLIWIACYIWSFTGTVTATGGAGGAGGAGSLNRGGGGGGGGGNGGTLLRMYNTIPNTGTTTLTGGAGGAGGAIGTGVSAAGSAGTTGATGETISIVI